jgi:hypothetical protein
MTAITQNLWLPIVDQGLFDVATSV